MVKLGTSKITTEDRIARLEDAQAAQTAQRRYVDAMDAQDLSLIPELFTTDAVLEVPGARFEGLEAIESFYRQAFIDDPTAKSHFHSNLDVRPQGNGVVEIRSYLLYLASGKDQSIIGWGSYDDAFQVDGGIAKFSFKRIGITRVVDSRQGWPSEVEP